MSGNIDGNNKIETMKKINAVKKEARQKAKLSKCFCCGKECTSFCNSHSLPQFILRNIADNGKVYYWNTISEVLFQHEYQGVNSAGVFHIICNDCDSKLFQEYETPSNYDKPITAKMLAEIDMKNNLRYFSKRLLEKEIYKYLQNEHAEYNYITNEALKVLNLDINEIKNSYKLSLNHLKKPCDNNYYIGYFVELPYVVPLACQVQIAMLVDLEGNTINYTYDEHKGHKIEVVNLCVFPMQDKTIIFMFVERKNKKYQRFFKQLKALENSKDVLKIINYMIFLYTEDFFISPNISKSVLAQLNLTFKKTNSGFGYADNRFKEFWKEKEKFLLINIPDILNLLSREYAITKKNVI